MLSKRSRGAYRISARGVRDFLGTKLFQELGTNLKKKDQNSGKKRNKAQEKRYKTQEKGTKLKKKGTALTKLQAQGGPLLPPLVATPGCTFQTF